MENDKSIEEWLRKSANAEKVEKKMFYNKETKKFEIIEDDIVDPDKHVPFTGEESSHY